MWTLLRTKISTPGIYNRSRILYLTKSCYQNCSISLKTQLLVTKHGKNGMGPLQKSSFHISQSMKQVAKRKTESLPFEIDSKVLKDTLLYTYENHKFFRMLSIFGAVQFFFWANLAVFSYSSMPVVLDNEVRSKLINPDSFWGKVVLLQSKYKDRIAFLCMTVGYVVLFFTWVYPQRSISKLTLQRGGEMLKVATYTHFGRTKELTIPLEHFSCVHRRGEKTTMSAKIKGKWFYYLMDGNSGQYHNTRIYDFVVGLRRKL